MSRFTFNFYNDIRKPLKSGLFSIKVNLYDAHEKKGINFTIKKVKGIEVSCSKNDWKDIWVNKDKKNNFGEVVGETTVHGHKNDIRTILKIKEDILNDILSSEGIMSLESIKKDFYNHTQPNSFTDNIYPEFERTIKELNEAQRYKSRNTYITTVNNIAKYNNHFKYSRIQGESGIIKGTLFRFTEVTKSWLEGYERTRSREGLSKGSIALDMRNLRAVYNRVKTKDPFLEEKYPFGTGANKYSIKEGTARNQGLSKEDMKKIFKFDSENTYLVRARDVFIFAYYGGGMNWKDLILLTQEDAENEYFVRAKSEFTTKKEVHVPLNLTPEQRRIIKKYEGKGKYLFSFLNDDATELDIFKKQESGVKAINKQLKKLSEEIGLGVKLTYGWSRHSFATNLHTADGVSEKSIQEAMGHTDAKTTRRYIDTLHKKESDSINQALDLDDGD